MAKTLLEVAVARVMPRVEMDERGCWVWTGATAGGYGQVTIHNRWRAYTHRLIYEVLMGPIEPGLQIDHHCRNKLCCNPVHLEPVTPGENFLRTLPFRAPNWRSRPKRPRPTHCTHGHEFNELNTYVTPDGHLIQCRTCKTERMRRYRSARP